MTFAFHAEFVHADPQCRRLSFLDRDDESSEHYLIFDRSEDSPEEPVADMANVYLERDDQQWGGYGGIESVTLTSDRLTLRLTPDMAKTMGQHDTIQISFGVEDTQWENIRTVLSLIMKGYDSRLVIDA
jgi:hypothetical protein